jgi:hypothetical protein
MLLIFTAEIWGDMLDKSQGKLLGKCADKSSFKSFKNERLLGNRFLMQDEVRNVAFAYVEVFYNQK